jgi:hypothetical protein
MTKPDDGAWFAPKRIGYGAGLPVAWQGWVLMLAFAVAVGLAAWRMHGAAQILTILGLTALFLPVCAAKTRGGWRWRSGRD